MNLFSKLEGGKACLKGSSFAVLQVVIPHNQVKRWSYTLLQNWLIIIEY